MSFTLAGIAGNTVRIGVITICNRDARQLFLHLQGLSARPAGPLNAAGLFAIIEALGFVQVDSIQTIARAHHHILFSRHNRYHPDLLTDLLEKQRLLFEHWTHDAAIIPSQWYPHWQPRFARSRERLSNNNWLRARGGDDFPRMLEFVRQRIADEGPLMSRDFERPARAQSGGWWQWAPAKTALEFLWRTGELSISARQGFQKIYDLSERVIPHHYRASAPSHDVHIDWACTTALDRLGTATAGEIAAFWETVTPAEVRDWIAGERGRRLVDVTIESADGSAARKAVAWAAIETQIGNLPKPSGSLRVLNPFDPLLRDRKRARRLFGFDYRIEIFVPEAKRVYGYYVFPLLEGDRLVGRADIKTDRRENALNVRAVWPEPGFAWTAARHKRFETELARLKRLADVGNIGFEADFLKA